MPLDGSGTYTPPAGSIVTTGTVISSIVHNAFVNDLITVLNSSVSIARGGTGGASASAARTNLGLNIGSDILAYSSSINALATLTSAANKLPYYTGSGTWGTTDFSSYMRGILGAVDAAALRSALSVSQSSDTVLKTDLGTTANKVVQLDGAAKLPSIDGSQLTNLPAAPDVIVKDKRTSGTNAGTGVVGTWTTRALTDLDRNILGATLSGNAITLPAGTYYVEFSSPFINTYNSQSRLFNTTDSSSALIGDTVYANVCANSTGSGVFTTVATKTFVLQSNITRTTGSLDFGLAGGFGQEIYCTLKIWKIG